MTTKDANSTESSETKASSRRDALRSLGLITGVAVASALTAAPAAAQTLGAKPVGPTPRPVNPDLDRASTADLKAMVLRSARLPVTTPITDMRLGKENVAKLTPAAQKLTKADLIALGQLDQGLNPSLSPAAESLTIKDIRSIRNVFTNVAGVGGAGGLAAAGDVSCCCCTPCCCAAAVVEPERKLA